MPLTIFIVIVIIVIDVIIVTVTTIVNIIVLCTTVMNSLAVSAQCYFHQCTLALQPFTPLLRSMIVSSTSTAHRVRRSPFDNCTAFRLSIEIVNAT